MLAEKNAIDRIIDQGAHDTGDMDYRVLHSMYDILVIDWALILHNQYIPDQPT